MSKTYTTKLYGASDDLVYACDDEFDSHDTPTYIRFNDGTLARIEYVEDGCWRIKVFTKGEANPAKKFGLPDDEDSGAETQCHHDEDAPSYSDVLVLTWDKPIEIVQRGHSPLKNPPAKLEVAKAIIDALNDRGGFDGWWSDVDADSRNEILEEIAKLVEAAK